MSGFIKLLHRRAFAAADPGLLQVSFEAAVLDRYRADARFRVMRTDTVCRIKQERGWALDAGIAPDERQVHASWRSLMSALPEGEREHWAMHSTVPSGYSDMFLRMQMSPGSCFDDGELRDW